MMLDDSPAKDSNQSNQDYQTEQLFTEHQAILGITPMCKLYIQNIYRSILFIRENTLSFLSLKIRFHLLKLFLCMLCVVFFVPETDCGASERVKETI